MVVRPPVCGEAEAGRVGAGAAAGASLASPAEDTVRWLLLVFQVSAMLWASQVALGFYASSLALLADSVHSGVDVLTYGFNFYVELSKLRAARLHNAALLDACGAWLSTLALLVASVVAVAEAAVRLGAADGPGDGYERVGPALLGFAVLGTLANVGVLVLLSWRRKVSRATTLLTVPESGPIEMPGRLGMEIAGAPAVGSAVYPPQALPGRSRKNGGGRRGKAGFCATYSKAPLAIGAGGEDIFFPCSGCAEVTCASSTSPRGGGGGGGGCDGSQNGGPRTMTWLPHLHNLVHPSCAASHGDCACDLSSAGEASSAASDNNLNLFAALLHLVADVLRSITILVAGLLVETGTLKDAGKVDAGCAIAVAAFIVAGSMALFHRMWRLLPSSWRDMMVSRSGPSSGGFGP